jgi:hypothetical protein
MSTPVHREQSKASALVRWSRLAVVALAWLFSAGVAIQVFLAGFSIFSSASYWEDHTEFGTRLGVVPVALIVITLTGRVPLRLVTMAAALLVLYGVQIALANASAGYVAALHPVNAFVLFGLAMQIGARTRKLTELSSGV